MRLVCISDTHLLNIYREESIAVPDGDVLIHCGDATMQGKKREVELFSEWLCSFTHKHKVFVPGNHDFGFETFRPQALAILGTTAHCLIDAGVTIEGIKFWGTPYQPWFRDWAFNVPRGTELRKHWDLIPDDTEILITHTPPYRILDKVEQGEHVGCSDLWQAVANRIKPKYHIFGHIHCGYGRVVTPETTFINCAMADEGYHITNAAVVIDL